MPPENIKRFIIDNYGPKEDPMLKVPLHFTAEQDGSSVSLVCFDATANDWEGEFIDSWCKLDYSIDGKSWNTYIDPDSEDETLRRGKVINLNKGETVYFKATLGYVQGNPNLNGFCMNSGDRCHYFVMEGSIKADGNIQFLLENTGTIDYVPEYCYHRMFARCTSLTQAPALPATTLANYCYSSMFSSCTSLTQAPILPATTLADECYSSMFYNCTSLTQVPELPATTLAESCYGSMFEGCTSLTQVPELPATTLADYCYYFMFRDCTNLNNINVNFSAWKPSVATISWVQKVASSGTFTCPTDLPEEFGNNRIPTGWTIVRK